jgi:hypothetical protein
MDDRAGPGEHLEDFCVLVEGCAEPESDADLDFHDVLLLSLDDRPRVRVRVRRRQPLDAEAPFTL